MTITSRKLFFSLPGRFRDEASLRAILCTFGGKLAGLECTVRSEDQVSGFCRFHTLEDARLVGECLHGLGIGEFSVQVSSVEETEDDLDSFPPPMAATAASKKRKTVPVRNSTPALDGEYEDGEENNAVAPARKKLGAKPKPSLATSQDVVAVKKRTKVAEDENGDRTKKKTMGKPKKAVTSSSSSEEEEKATSKSAVPISTIAHTTNSHKSSTAAAEGGMKSTFEKPKRGNGSGGEEEVWEEYMDERYNVPYYFNPSTKETTWELPSNAGRIVKPSATTGQAVASVSTAVATVQQPLVEEPLAATTTAVAATVVVERPRIKQEQQPPLLTTSSSSSSLPSSSLPPVSSSSSRGGGSSMGGGLDKRGSSTEVFVGTVANVKQGFGFINSPTFFNNRSDLFFHFDELMEPTSVFFPKKGDEVEFELSYNHNRGQSIAVRVRRPGRGGISSLPPLSRSASHPVQGSSSMPSSLGGGGGGSRNRSPRQISHRRTRSRSPQPSSQSSSSMNMLRRSTSDGYMPRGGGGWNRDPPSSSSQQQQQTWVRYMDRKSNLPYWHCPATNETTWTNPE
ncbi:hypothetical protein BASA81_003922 [Batrachochytrium salamandrivorans]|nr:hypothetical protein BASA81_003922 [Batrachochytrium salamandrivorans]